MCPKHNFSHLIELIFGKIKPLVFGCIFAAVPLVYTIYNSFAEKKNKELIVSYFFLSN